MYIVHFSTVHDKLGAKGTEIAVGDSQHDLQQVMQLMENSDFIGSWCVVGYQLWGFDFELPWPLGTFKKYNPSI